MSTCTYVNHCVGNFYKADPVYQHKTTLHTALESQDFTLASQLIQNGANMDVLDETGLRPLDYCFSLEFEPPDGVNFRNFLLRYLQEIANARLKGERSVVHILAYWDSYHLLQLILQHKRCSADVLDKYHQCPFHYCFSRDIEISVNSVYVLYQTGADINVTNVDGFNPLHLLRFHRLAKENCMKILVCDIVKLYAKRDGMCPVHLAAANGDTDLVEYFVDCGVDINIADPDGFTPLHLAVLREQVTTVELLIHHQANVNAKNEQDQTPLHYASVLPHVNCSMVLLKASACVNAGDTFGMKPIHKASGWGKFDTVKLFIQHGSQIDDPDNSGKLPIHYSALNGTSEIAELLILKGSKFDDADKSGQTALHLAANGDRIEILKLLLLHGCDPNTQDIDGQTPLHLACLKGNKEAVRTLINRGASKNIMTSQGLTPVGLATELGHYSVLSILREHRQSLSLYAPEQLKTFEMFRNFTAPTRLDALGQESDNEDSSTIATHPTSHVTHHQLSQSAADSKCPRDNNQIVPHRRGSSKKQASQTGDENGNLHTSKAKNVIHQRHSLNSAQCCVLS